MPHDDDDGDGDDAMLTGDAGERYASASKSTGRC